MPRNIAIGLLACFLSGGALADVGTSPNLRAEALLAELVNFESTADHPELIVASVDAAAKRLLAAGFPSEDVQIVSPGDDKASLVVRYRGRGNGKAVLLMAHIDVVQADPAGWSCPPFEFGKDERWYYGRGTLDNKTGVVSIVANFIRLREEGYVPERDLIGMITGDEETDGRHADWLATEGRHLIEAAFALNSDGGGGLYDDDGKPSLFAVQNSEKLYQTFYVTATNAGGHSSVPRADNAIYDLAAALGRLAEHEFPLQLDETSRTRLARTADVTPGDLGDAMRAASRGDVKAAERVAKASPYLNSTLRTTCVATELDAGHAENALPRGATATVNCRIYPGIELDEVETTLADIMGSESVSVRRTAATWGPSMPPSPLLPDVLGPVEDIAQAMWPGTPVIPVMSTGATDGLFLRRVGIPVYGVSAIFTKRDDNRAHGLDERIGVTEFDKAIEYWYRLLKRFGG